MFEILGKYNLKSCFKIKFFVEQSVLLLRCIKQAKNILVLTGAGVSVR